MGCVGPETPRGGEDRAVLTPWGVLCVRCAQTSAGTLAIAETSNSSLTFSLTRTPPVSRAALKERFQSVRSMVTSPSKPTRVLPNGSLAEPVSSKGIVTDLVTPLMVRSPVMAHSAPSRSTSVETKVICG